MAAQYKHCPGCCETGETIPADEFDKDKNQPDGLAELCKDCLDEGLGALQIEKPKAKKAKTVKAKPEPTAPAPETPERVCTKCGKSKPLETGFPVNKSRPSGYDTHCRDCKNEHQNAYRAKIKGIVPEIKAAVKFGPKPVKFEGPATNVDIAKHIKPEAREETQAPYLPKSDYYDAGGISTLAVIRAKLTPEEYRGFLKGNALKYLCRANYKGDTERDMEKASTYAKWAAEA